MSNMKPRRKDCTDLWENEHYETYLIVKDLSDDIEITFDLTNHETEVFTHHTMTVGELKKIGKLIEERRSKAE